MKYFSVLALLLVAVFFGGSTPSIPGKASVASLEQVSLNGVKQWILIRGDDRSSPVLLFLHGGPGMPMMYLAHAFQRPLERDFVVVQWDRSGAGKSFGVGQPSRMRVSQELADATALIEILQRRFGRRPVIVVGHSYGSYLGVALAKDRPDLLRAYVGVGQLACTDAETAILQDDWLRTQAAKASDTKTLAAIDAHQTWDREGALFRYGGEVVGMKSFLPLLVIGLKAPEYTLADAVNVKRGVAFTHAHLVDDGPGEPLYRTVPKLQVPTFFFAGRQDFTAPTVCAQRYFDTLAAPRKAWVWFEHSAHFPFLEEPERFSAEMRRVAELTKP